MNYTFGLDIGIASCGWCVIDHYKGRIVDWGVRIFDKAENPKDGSSLNEPRRLARSQRRRLRRRTYRLYKIRELFVSQGMFESMASMTEMFDRVKEHDDSVWELRKAGLSRLLNADEWARVLYRISKRRGYKSNRRLEAGELDATKQQERGLVATKITALRQVQTAENYRTVGETIASTQTFAGYKRNRHGRHLFHIDRSMLEEEMEVLFEMQRLFGNPYTSTEFETKLKHWAFTQRPFATKELLVSKIGKCTFERGLKRAPKHSRTMELFVFWEKINHLRIVKDGKDRELTFDEKQMLFKLVHEQKEIKYKTIRTKLKLGDDERFKGLIYPIQKQGAHDDKKKARNPEDQRVVQMKFFHAVREALAVADASEWERLQTDLLRFDALADILTLCKNDDEMEKELSALAFSEPAIQACIPLSFAGYGHLSYVAYRKILEFLEQGMSYDKACTEAGYEFRNLVRDKHKYLPPIDIEEVRNPIVLRALTQARKVLNAMIRTFDSPYQVHIELARDLARHYDERKKITKQIESNRAEKERQKQNLMETIPQFMTREPKAGDILKKRLWDEQSGFCLYSGKYIDPRRLFEDGYVEVDHILPYSRSLDDSYMNKALVLQDQNRVKLNKTPFEWFGQDTQRWAELEVRAKRLPYKKQLNVLRKTPLRKEERDEFIARQLNDTRYISRYFSSYIRQHLLITNNKVICVNGQFTAFLRTRFGLGNIKNRSEDIHHAIDALMVACTNEAMIYRITAFHKKREMYNLKSGEHYVDPETGEIVDEQYRQRDNDKHFPKPWDDFRHEVFCRLGIDPRQQNLERLGDPRELIEQNSLNQYVGLSEDDWKHVRPIFVSRAPNHKVTGKAHQDTVKGIREQEEQLVKVKKRSLASIIGKNKTMKIDEVDKLIDSIYGNDPALREAVREWLLNSADLQEDLKLERYPRKPAKNGEGPMIRSVKVVETSMAGVKVHKGKGIAENESMVRIDLFEKAGKYYAVPIYVSDTTRAELPNRAAKAGPEENWDVMDESFSFKFSLYPNDLIELEVKDKKYFGYYSAFNRATASLEIISHDRSGANQGKWGSIGFKTNVKSFKKYTVDPLGHYFQVRGEKRHGFSQRSN